MSLRRDLSYSELFDAFGMFFRLFEHRMRFGERGIRRTEFHFKPGRIDAVQDVPRLYVGTLLEQALHDNSGDARTNLSDANWYNSSWQFANKRARGWLHRNHRDFWRSFGFA